MTILNQKKIEEEIVVSNNLIRVERPGHTLIISVDLEWPEKKENNKEKIK